MKKKLSFFLSILTAMVLFLAACGNGGNGNGDTEENGNGAEAVENGEEEAAPAGDDTIAVVSREEGSGSRAAFEDLVGVNDEDNPDSMMRTDVIIQDGNGVVSTFVQGNEAAIGYVSFVTLDDAGDALVGLSIDGVEPTVENVINGTFPLAREFNMVWMEDELSEVAEAFVEFIQSVQGLEELEADGNIVDFEGAEDFDASAWEGLEGSLALGGSTTIEGPALAVAEAFGALFPGVSFSYESMGSGAGITGPREGNLDIGFASRAVEASELEGGLTAVPICREGLAIVVNPANDVTNITLEQLKDIYIGNISSWTELR